MRLTAATKAALGALALMLSTDVGAAPVRTEVPIQSVILSDGAQRYSVPVRIGRTLVTAGLDTGSSGLRVLPGAVGADDATADGPPDSYGYGSGARLRGRVGRARVAFGDVAGETRLQIVSIVDCAPSKPRCPVSNVSSAQYGVQGDGLPGKGFKAILGINMAEAEVATPLRALGASRWIVELPRRGEAAPGRLILNPTDAETASYAMLPVIGRYSASRGGLHDAVEGCLTNVATGENACGAMMLDCGAPGMTASGTPLKGPPWPDGASATLSFKAAQGRVAATETLTIGLRAHGSHLAFDPQDGDDGPVIYTGMLAYLAFSVLYDPLRGRIGLKPRRPAPDGPTGQIAAAPGA